MKKITSQKPIKLQFVEGISVSKEIVFSSVSKALEFYYNNTLAYPRGIDYERSLEKEIQRSVTPEKKTDWLDVFATIGLYLGRLGNVERLLLALFFGAPVRYNDKEIALALNRVMKVKNYCEESVRILRFKVFRKLSNQFIKIGIVKPRG